MRYQNPVESVQFSSSQLIPPSTPPSALSQTVDVPPATMKSQHLTNYTQNPSSQFIPVSASPTIPQFHSFIAELENVSSEKTGSRCESLQVPNSTSTSIGGDARPMSIHQKLDNILAILQQQQNGSCNTALADDSEYYYTIFPLDNEDSVKQFEEMLKEQVKRQQLVRYFLAHLCVKHVKFALHC